jgi:hypothetical protein
VLPCQVLFLSGREVAGEFFSLGESPPGGFFSLGESPPDFVRQPTSFHLLAQIKGGKAKCLNASDTTELHGWKENAVDDEHLQLPHRVGYRRTLAEQYARRAHLSFLWKSRSIADAVLEPKVPAISRILFPAMQFSRIAGVGHFALPTFICASK